MNQYVGIFSPEYMSPILGILFGTSKSESESIYYYIEKVDSLTEA